MSTIAKRLDKFAFTGSTAVGRQIGAIAGHRNLLHPTLRLGGKRSADRHGRRRPRQRRERRAVGRLRHRRPALPAPATSSSTPIYDEFKRRFLAAAQAKSRSATRSSTPMCCTARSSTSASTPTGLRTTTGAAPTVRTLLYGQGRITRDCKPAGFQGDPAAALYGWPTIWDAVTPDMRLFQREVFGPTINLVRVNGIDGDRGGQ
ncbi:MAG: aldehyde dehydrogenase family protein [Kouleothrix sp.]